MHNILYTQEVYKKQPDKTDFFNSPEAFGLFRIS